MKVLDAKHLIKELHRFLENESNYKLDALVDIHLMFYYILTDSIDEAAEVSYDHLLDALDQLILIVENSADNVIESRDPILDNLDFGTLVEMEDDVLGLIEDRIPVILDLLSEGRCDPRLSGIYKAIDMLGCEWEHLDFVKFDYPNKLVVYKDLYNEDSFTEVFA